MARPKKQKVYLPSSSYEEIKAIRLREPLLGDKGKSFKLAYIDPGNNGREIPCSKKLYREVETDKLYTNYRIEFVLHKNTKSGLVEYITTTPKDLYRSYEVEYEEDMKVPDKEVYKDPS